MTCPKCQGLMVVERFYDFFDRFSAGKCLNCGEVLDYKIRENRLLSRQHQQPKVKKERVRLTPVSSGLSTSPGGTI